ncbi:MAG: hypothetical protein RR454_04235, partial [Clostridia bacterium]
IKEVKAEVVEAILTTPTTPKQAIDVVPEAEQKNTAEQKTDKAKAEKSETEDKAEKPSGTNKTTKKD